MTVVNVNSYATLRRAPGFDQDIVYEAPRGSELRVLDHDGARLLGSDGQVYDCRNLCEVSRRTNSTTALGRARMTQCFEENVLWFEAVAPNGERGWISGKYIE